MHSTKNVVDQLRAIARHHHEHGGGLRWFRLQDDRFVPLTADTGVAATDYRFRLRSLSRLAAQCGIAGMNEALDAVSRHESDALTDVETEDEEVDAL
jgi:hypothetical protein